MRSSIVLSLWVISCGMAPQKPRVSDRISNAPGDGKNGDAASSGKKGDTASSGNKGDTASSGNKGDTASSGRNGDSIKDNMSDEISNGGTNGIEDKETGQDNDSTKPLNPGATDSAVYEAEDSFHGGTAKLAKSIPGYSSTGYLEGLARAKDKIIFSVQSKSLAASTFNLRYAASAAKKIAIHVNGTKFKSIELSASPTFKDLSVPVNLRSGLNTLALVHEEASDASVMIDKIEVKNAAPRASRGATVDFVTYEAELGKSNASIVGPSRKLHEIPSAASGRKAIVLDATGKYVEWKLSAAANAMVIRYSMPDSSDGKGTQGSLSVYVDGKKRKSINLSSKYAWVYGGYPFGNNPEQGKAHRFFDDSRIILGDIPNGAVVRLQKDAEDTSPSYTIDLFELETVPSPYMQPAESISILDYGAKPDDGIDDSQAIRSAIAAAKAANKDLWIPVGEFGLYSRLELDQVTLRGAGPWYSVLKGLNGKGGFHGTGNEVRLFDFAIFGDVSYRDDGAFDAGVDGKLGKNSMIQNIWFEHTKVGIWSEDSTDGLLVTGCRIRNTFADGVNFYSGTKNSSVENTHIRGTGDDGLAMWPEKSGEYNQFRFNTIMLPDLANGIGIYGGVAPVVSDNLITDTQEASAGIAVSTRFTAVDFSGVTLIERNTIVRAGGWERNWNTSFGALWIYADQRDITANIVVRDLEIVDATYQGILLSFNKRIENLLLERVKVIGAGTSGLEINATGSATFNDVSISGAKDANKLPVSGFTIKGNSKNL